MVSPPRVFLLPSQRAHPINVCSDGPSPVSGTSVVWTITSRRSFCGASPPCLFPFLDQSPHLRARGMRAAAAQCCHPSPEASTLCNFRFIPHAQAPASRKAERARCQQRRRHHRPTGAFCLWWSLAARPSASLMALASRPSARISLPVSWSGGKGTAPSSLLFEQALCRTALVVQASSSGYS